MLLLSKVNLDLESLINLMGKTGGRFNIDLKRWNRSPKNNLIPPLAPLFHDAHVRLVWQELRKARFCPFWPTQDVHKLAFSEATQYPLLYIFPWLCLWTTSEGDAIEGYETSVGHNDKSELQVEVHFFTTVHDGVERYFPAVGYLLLLCFHNRLHSSSRHRQSVLNSKWLTQWKEDNINIFSLRGLVNDELHVMTVFIGISPSSGLHVRTQLSAFRPVHQRSPLLASRAPLVEVSTSLLLS